MTTAQQQRRSRNRVVVLTGAGISAESGIATYRAAGSSWTDPTLERRSHASAYGNHLPALWDFWGSLRRATAAAEPNLAHQALATQGDRCARNGGSLTVLTQNVDGLHQRAGSADVLELHGSIHRTRCMRRACRAVFTDTRIPEPGTVLTCPTCQSRTRADITLFGEQLPTGALRRAREVMAAADLCVYVGTSGNVWPAADLVSVAAAAGALCVLVNAEPWPHPHPDFERTVLGMAGQVLPTVLEELIG